MFLFLSREFSCERDVVVGDGMGDADADGGWRLGLAGHDTDERRMEESGRKRASGECLFSLDCHGTLEAF